MRECWILFQECVTLCQKLPRLRNVSVSQFPPSVRESARLASPSLQTPVLAGDELHKYFADVWFLPNWAWPHWWLVPGQHLDLPSHWLNVTNLGLWLADLTVPLTPGLTVQTSRQWDMRRYKVYDCGPGPAGSGETGNFWQKDGQICISSIGYDQITAWSSDNLLRLNEWS